MTFVSQYFTSTICFRIKVFSRSFFSRFSIRILIFSFEFLQQSRYLRSLTFNRHRRKVLPENLLAPGPEVLGTHVRLAHILTPRVNTPHAYTQVRIMSVTFIIENKSFVNDYRLNRMKSITGRRKIQQKRIYNAPPDGEEH